ncbi:uncharacterized protein [Amphiura filiformis]|uniref:uncharacterized protein n=1 Tax=Amphiura filiformis TaxID=82378 RepID=UPI003B21C921
MMRWTSTNGGIMRLYNRDLKNRDGSSREETRNYTGRTTAETSYFRFDFDSPYHCTQGDSCLTTMLDSVPHISTQDGVIDVTWSGWQDDVSCVADDKYDLRVVHLSQDLGDHMLEEVFVNTVYHMDSLSSRRVSVTLPPDVKCGVFSFILTTRDYAGNWKLTRRFVLHDSVSQITKRSGQLLVTSASTKTDYTWITEISSTGPTSVVLNWAGHFVNHDHDVKGLLWEITDHMDLSSEYDHYFGIRGKAAIPNAEGITKFRVSHIVDTTSGCRNAQPSAWEDQDISTSLTLPLNIADGNAICFWVRAQDIVGHTIDSDAVVHVDSSPPVIPFLWLERDGETNLAVHSTTNFQDMNAVFEAYDEHSGLNYVHWELFDNFTDTIMPHGNGTLAVVDEDSCTDNCVCIPKGNCYQTIFTIDFKFDLGHHDHDYFLTVTVKNNAELISTRTLKITVDTSAPLVGSVHDGMPGSPEVDFQQSVELVGHWNGFFDKESGIKFYEYTFSTECWDGTSASSMVTSRTLLPNVPVSWSAPGPGRYYISVIAYNRALEPSGVVCSDGVTIDNTPPEVTSIDIKNARVHPGLVKDIATDEVWLVRNDRQRCKLDSEAYDAVCLEQTRPIDDIALLPVIPNLNNSMCETAVEYCNPAGTNVFLSVDKHIAIYWNGWDNESYISDYEIGFSSNPDNEIPDLSMFSTQGHSQYTMYHPDITQGMLMYLMIKATNKAHISTRKVIGPIIVDTTAPEIIGDVSLMASETGLIAQWKHDDISDPEDPELSVFIAIGHNEKGTGVLPYTNIKSYDASRVGMNTEVVIPFESLDWYIHGDHVYYASILVENSAGLSSVITSQPYRHVIQLPARGVVLDVESTQGEGFGEVRDIDVQPHTDSLAIRWYGFQHPHLNITYKVSFGAEPGQSELTDGYISVGNNHSFEATELSLVPFQTYYGTIIAETDAGSVSITSDGVTIIPRGSVANDLQVFDGFSCNASSPDKEWQTTHHEQVYIPHCKDDITFQASTSVVDSHWIIGDELKPFVTHVLWSLEEEVHGNDSAIAWAVIVDAVDLGLTNSHRRANVFLKDGCHYRSNVKLCHTVVCFESKNSDGFWIISRPPLPGEVNIASIEAIDDETHVTVQFQDFSHEYLSDDYTQYEYKWAIIEQVSQNEQHFITKWQGILEEALDTVNGMLRFQAVFNGHLPRVRCIQLILRGYNDVGLFATASTDIFDCEDPDEISPNIVIDAVDVIMLPKNERWTESDVDYTSNTNNIYAVWPTLRHGFYEWAVIEVEGTYEFQIPDAPQEPCQHPTAIKCGHTDLNFVNVQELTLQHGQRYRVCLHANATNITHDEWTEIIPKVSACSDGVIVDITPPVAGQVWIGWREHSQYQISTTELALSWESYVDVEEHGKSPHHSGIKEYEFAIGSVPGGSDVQGFQNVGITNSAIARNLRLQSGHRYYATVKGTDFVGFSSIAVSHPVIIDSTPPIPRGKRFNVDGGNFLTSVSTIIASWNNTFLDLESGIDYYEWAIGSNPGHADILPFVETKHQRAESPGALNLQEGHSYYITVKATNKAGLVSVQSYGAFSVDASQPIPGHVYDGSPDLMTPNQKDQDFQTDTATLHAFWEGFHDPHSSLIGYWWIAGTCPECNDVLEEQYVGLHTNVSVEYLHLVPGLIYFVTVRACNAADLCTSVTSDGILIDDSPPSAGHVYDGPPGRDLSFQASRNTIAAYWWGFHDAQSGLLRYEWRAGTQQRGSDIVNSTTLHLTDSVFKILDAKLPIGVTMYVTIRVYNRVGLWRERSSNGFQIDSTPPEMLQPPAMDSTKGTINEGSQVMRSIIAFSWNFDDPESGIVAHYLSVHSEHNDDIEILPTKISGGANEYTFTNLDLHDGSQYTVGVMACNGAGRCTQIHTFTFKVDSSRPSTGYFAIQSEHAANLIHRDIDGYMNWLVDGNGTTSLNLAWLGFTDVHSGITEYALTIGTTYNGQDLHQNGTVQHDDSGLGTEEGPIQRTTISLQNGLTETQRLYASLWAVNGVGLESSRAIAAFDVLPGGVLMLIRRCTSYSCEGHCVCASQDQLCERQVNSCGKYTGDTLINVTDVINVRFDTIEDIDYSPSRCIMAASWNPVGQDLPNWYEWSAGDHTSTDEEPTGVFDITHDRVWHDVGAEELAIFPLPRGNELDVRNTKYYFFVRAWFNEGTYAVYRSDGVTPDVSPPQIKKQRAVRVKDVHSGDDENDIDVTTNPNESTVSWQNVFTDGSQIDHFEVALGTVPEGENVRTFSDHIQPASAMNLMFSDLDLVVGQRYFCSVRAYNKAGLHSIQSSDGFLVDTIPPLPGVVYDGEGLHDLEFQNSTTLLSASWHGFIDFESYIYRYDWCIGTTTASDECDVIDWTSVGLKSSATKTLKSPLTGGFKYYSKIIAVDSAGLQSTVVVSDGVVIDTTPPVRMQAVNIGSNLLQNPSFELVPPSGSLGSEMESFPLSYWNTSLNTKAEVIRAGTDNAQDGIAFAVIFGSISQTFPTTSGHIYRISFHVSHVNGSREPLLNQEGRIQATGLNEVFKLYDRPADAHSLTDQELPWLHHTYYFTSNDNESEITLSSLGRTNGMLLDIVQVQEVTYGVTNHTTDSYVHVKTQFVLNWASIEAKWHFIDPESPVVEYRWAIGYVKGGTQLQNFVSVGTKSHAINSELSLVHGSKVTVTVMATNAAGLSSLSYSNATTVDFTPPTIHHIYDGTHQKDVDYILMTNFTISWSSSDEESGIQYCDYAVGSSPGDTDIYRLTRHHAPTGELQLNVNDTIIGGQKIYTTVKCFNGAMLSTTRTSDGAIVATRPPDAEYASVTIKRFEVTGYLIRDIYQFQSTRVRASWNGFMDAAGIAYYECALLASSSSDGNWTQCGSSSERHVTIDELDLKHGEAYTLYVRAVNNAGLQSDTVQETLFIETGKPRLTGVTVGVKWLEDTKVQITWTGVFMSTSQLIYEVSIGTVEGGSDVLQWVETLDTHLEMSPLHPSTDYYIAISAINTVGLYETIKYVIIG